MNFNFLVAKKAMLMQKVTTLYTSNINQSKFSIFDFNSVIKRVFSLGSDDDIWSLFLLQCIFVTAELNPKSKSAVDLPLGGPPTHN